MYAYIGPAGPLAAGKCNKYQNLCYNKFLVISLDITCRVFKAFYSKLLTCKTEGST